MKRCRCALLFCLVSASGSAQSPARPAAQWTPELSMRVQSVGEVVPSPDGRLAVYTQTRAVMEAEKSEFVTQIYLRRARGSEPVQLTHGERSATSPSFSPEGQFVYFVSARSGAPNLWRIRVNGGEPEMLTEWKGSLGIYRLSPDGWWVAFTGVAPRPEEEKARREKRDFRVADDNPKNYALWVVPAQGRGDARKLFESRYHITGFAWAPDSRSIAFVHQPGPGPEDSPKSDISEVDVASGAVRPVAATPADEREPVYSPDGRYLAYLRSSDPPRSTRDYRIVLAPRHGGTPRPLPATYDELPTLVGWSADSARLLFTEGKGPRQVLYSMPVDGLPRALYEPARGTISSVRLSAGSAHIGFVLESWDQAPEAFTMSLSGGAPVEASRANAGLPKPPLGETKVIRWKGADGLPIEGLLTYPVGYQAGTRYPLVLNIHGGPHGAFHDSFIGGRGLYPIAALAAKGYAVLRPNPRGSTNYGKSFRYANLGDWGGKDYQDLMAGVDHVIALGVADPERLAVMGWSYGGYMTSWVITQTQRFKAAAVGAGVSDILSQAGTSDIRSNKLEVFGAPWESPQRYIERSPLTHAKSVTTPTLILHGEADQRVPISQGYELYHALKTLGVTTQMVVYPRAPHSPAEPKFILDIMQRHLEWVAKYVR